jgi:putative aldouronate transport system substrate-binding protein
MTGATIDWIFPPVGTSREQLTAQQFAGNIRDMPNIMITYIGSVDQLIDEGIMWDLTPYIERWMPNYWRYLQADPNRAKAMKTDSGRYWSVGFFREDGPFMDTWSGPSVRKDWLDAQNLPIPRTIADWDRTVQVFKERYNAMFIFPQGMPIFAGAFGAYAGYTYEPFIRNGRVLCANTQPEWRDYLAKLNEWYTRGYLDPDHLTIDYDTFFSKALQGQFGLTWSAASWLTALVNNSAAANDGAQWIGIEPPRGPNNTLASIQGGWGMSNNAWISRSVTPERLELVMRVLDYAFTDEGHLFQNYGLRGDTWDYDAQGRINFLPKFLNDIDQPNVGQVAMKYAGQRGGMSGIQATRFVQLTQTTTAWDAFTSWYSSPEAAYSWRLPPGITYTEAEALRNQELGGAIDTYIQESAVRFVTGQTPLSQFDAYVTRLNQMGLAERLATAQAAYDRWQRR